MASPNQFRCRRGNKQWKSSCVAVYQFESIAAGNQNVGNSVFCPSQEAEPHDLALSERSGARPMSCWSTTEGADGFTVLECGDKLAILLCIIPPSSIYNTSWGFDNFEHFAKWLC